MNNSEVEIFVKKAQDITKKVKRSKAAAKKLLDGTGMYTSKGKLKKAFK